MMSSTVVCIRRKLPLLFNPFLDTAPFFSYYSYEKKLNPFHQAKKIIHLDHISAFFFVDQSPFWEMWYFDVCVICIVAMIGYIIYRQQERHRRQVQHNQNLFTRQLIDSMEAERKRIATELHDSIGQELLIIKNRALLALNDLKNKKNVREQLDEISHTASQAIQETREITNNLRPYQIDRLGLKKSLESIINRVVRTTTISFASDIDPIDNLIPKEMEIHVYRIIQECVNNIIKHAHATVGKVTVKRWYNRLNIDIEDNGTGFDVALQRIQNERGIGLQGIVERTRFIGGTMRIESNPGKGTRVLITIKTYDRIDDEN
jgi:signal transduction histidine kinase